VLQPIISVALNYTDKYGSFDVWITLMICSLHVEFVLITPQDQQFMERMDVYKTVVGNPRVVIKFTI
jgi:hypothetical protein